MSGSVQAVFFSVKLVKCRLFQVGDRSDFIKVECFSVQEDITRGNIKVRCHNERSSESGMSE